MAIGVSSVESDPPHPAALNRPDSATGVHPPTPAQGSDAGAEDPGQRLCRCGTEVDDAPGCVKCVAGCRQGRLLTPCLRVMMEARRRARFEAVASQCRRPGGSGRQSHRSRAIDTFTELGTIRRVERAEALGMGRFLGRLTDGGAAPPCPAAFWRS